MYLFYSFIVSQVTTTTYLESQEYINDWRSRYQSATFIQLVSYGDNDHRINGLK